MKKPFKLKLEKKNWVLTDGSTTWHIQHCYNMKKNDYSESGKFKTPILIEWKNEIRSLRKS